MKFISVCVIFRKSVPKVINFNNTVALRAIAGINGNLI